MASAPKKAEPADDANVVSVSPLNSKHRVISVKRPEAEKSSFITATLKGLAITTKHFFTNVTKGTDIATLQYPEETIPYPERNRGLHRLMQRDDGRVRCVACMCCPTACPANCITIVPNESNDPNVEKYPVVFEIDELRCIACGLCVEACPCDAIRMDTGEHAKPTEHRSDAIETLESMLARGIASTAVQGGEGADWRDNNDDE